MIAALVAAVVLAHTPIRLHGTRVVGRGGCQVQRDPRTHEIKRRHSVVAAFLRRHDLTHTPKGCQVDHIVALECGGCDEVANLQLLCEPSLDPKERREGECGAYEVVR